jgi:hypothetical protein
MRRNRAFANAELADLRVYGNGEPNQINRAESAVWSLYLLVGPRRILEGCDMA